MIRIQAAGRIGNILFLWAFAQSISRKNYENIEKDMNTRNSTSRKKNEKPEMSTTRKKREELSISATKSIKKEVVEISLTFI